MKTWNGAAAAVALAALAGCGGGYVSSYVPPADGRARPMWRDDHVVMEVSPPPPLDCAATVGASPDVAAWNGGGGHGHAHVSGVFWVPIYVGPPIVVVHPGRAPAPPPPTPMPHRRAASPSGPVGAHPASASGGGGAPARGGRGGKDDMPKEAIAVLAVAALVALPVISIALATGRPEPEDETSSGIDATNAYNDLARTPGTPCSIYWIEGGPQGGTP